MEYQPIPRVLLHITDDAADNLLIWTLSTVSILGSPLRKCIWSQKVMPNDFLVGIKLALFDSAAGEAPDSLRKDAGSSTAHSLTKTSKKTSFFARNILHPKFAGAQASKGKKQERGYIVCRRSGVHDCMLRGKPELQFEGTPWRNPLLVFQIESQLRRRIVQETQLLCEQADAAVKSGKRNDMPLLRVLTGNKVSELEANQLVWQAGEGSPIEAPPMAILEISRSSEEQAVACLVPPDGYSRLVICRKERTQGPLKVLPEHRFPVYSIPNLFNLDVVGREGSVTEAAGAGSSDSSKAPSENPEYPYRWSKLAMTHKDLFEQESKACLENMGQVVSQIQRLAMLPSSTSRANVSHVCVPAGVASVLPLLKALWRYRLWTGEGWTGDGFGVLEATGRREEAATLRKGSAKHSP